MFLDEALKKEPKSLQETFHTWYDFMEDRITFGQFVSLLHTKNHCARVLLYCLKIANLAKLSEEERSVLVKASVFHDSRRQDDTRDVGHGARAAENFKAFAERGEVAFDERTYLIMAYHDRDDEQGKEALRKRALKKRSCSMIFSRMPMPWTAGAFPQPPLMCAICGRTGPGAL